MGVGSGCGEQEVGVASGSVWNLWVWLLGVVVRRYRRSGNFRCYNIFVNVRAYENFTHEYFDSHSVSVSTVCRLSFTVKNLSHSSRPNALVHVVAADTQLSFESLHRNFTPIKKNS